MSQDKQDLKYIECTELQKEKIKFLLEAIKDGQGIIARLDAKARFYLAIYLAIAGGFTALVKMVIELYLKYKLYAYKEFFVVFLSISLFILAYTIILTIFTIKKVISPRNNPVDKIICKPENLKFSLFYPISQNNFLDYLNYKNLLQNIKNCEDIVEILLIENLKIAAIREEKMKSMYEIENALKLLFVIIIGIIIFLLILCFIFLCKIIC